MNARIKPRLLGALFLVLCLVQQPAYAQDPIPPDPPINTQEPIAPEQEAGLLSSPDDDPAIECDNGVDATHPPAPGKTAKVIGDDEIFLVYRNDTTEPYLRQKVINFDIATNKLVTVKDEAWSSDPNLASNTWWLNAAAGDLNGTADGKRADRGIAGFQNANGQLAAIADASPDTVADNDWWCQEASDRNRCDNVSDVDVAAGNLDMSADYSDEVVLVFRDQEADYHMFTLDGGSNANISTAEDRWVAEYWEDHHPGRERGDVVHFGVATGDLNGDGFDNEVVTVVKDSGSDLQVSVHRGDTLKELFYWDSYYGNPKIDTVAASCDGWGNWRPLDVAAGDVDGDFKDEAIVAARSGNCTAGIIELLVFDFKPEDPTTHALTIDTSVPVVRAAVDPSSYKSYEAAIAVSVSSADLDGDGYDEIALGYTLEAPDPSTGLYSVRQALVGYQFFRAETPLWQAHCPQPATLLDKAQSCLYKYTNIWQSPSPYLLGNEVDYYSRVSVTTGDVDANGIAEVALSRTDNNQDARVTLFRADTTTLTEVDTLTILASKPIHDPSVAMGDYDGDSKWGTYANTCRDKKQAVVQSVIQAPPFWPNIPRLNGCSNEWYAFGQFGMNSAYRDSNEQSLQTTIGGSVTSSKERKGITGSFSRGWQRSSYKSQETSTETTEASTYHTTPPAESTVTLPPFFTGVLTIEDTQFCYDYNVPGLDETNPTANVVVPVCVYRPDEQSLRTGSSTWWYSDTPQLGARALYPETWIPLGANLAQDTTQNLRKAKQSSTWTNGSPTGDAYRAVDGNTDGLYINKSVTCTNIEDYPWWQVDMGGLVWIDAIRIWNRTDAAYAPRLKNYYVLTTDQADFAKDPADPTGQKYKPLPDLVADPNVWSRLEANEAGTPTTITVGKYARVVRVQLNYREALNLAEVQIYGRPGTPDQWPVSIAKTDDGTGFNLGWRTNAAQTTVARPVYLIGGTTNEKYVTNGGLTTSFTTGYGNGLSIVEGSGKSRSLTVGMETKRKKLPTKQRNLSVGYEQTNSTATTWEKYVEFGGQVTGIPADALGLNYKWSPYVWMQDAVPEEGGTVEYPVLDYTVSEASALPEAGPPKCDGILSASAASSAALALPQAPVVSSPTHPNLDAWNPSNSVTFDWAQPRGDPATVLAYEWVLDRYPDTVPPGISPVDATTTTYPELRDGIWYLHVRAMNEQQEWGAAGHLKIQVDADAPQVSLALDPPQPTGNAGWYVTPVNVIATATDKNGSGVAGIEYSLDGATWYPYAVPVGLTTDTPGTTVHARASDNMGHTSEPVSVAVKIDRTPPDSHVAGGGGTLVAEVRTDPAGNQMAVLAGAIADSGSGRAGFVLDDESMYWGGDAEVGSWHPLPDPAIEVNWVYTDTHGLGAGYHIFTGRARDEAGNQEEPYEIGRLLVPPLASPDLRGSSITASQQAARPGDEILVTVTGRNAGYQEAHIAISATLPEGLEPVVAALPPGASYDAGTRTVTWPSWLLWPGQWQRRVFLARVDPGLGATTLEHKATFRAFWPNTDLLSEAEQKQFLDREQTFVATTRILVDPNLPAGADLVRPWAIVVPTSRQQVSGAEFPLSITAAPDVQQMYLREWAPDPLTGAWKVMQESGWIEFSPTYTWQLSAGQGVKFVGVWFKDAAGNVSALSEGTMTFVNRLDAGQVLSAGQRIQYRGYLDRDETMRASLKTVSGDPDLYLWEPRNSFWPDRSANDTLEPGYSEELASVTQLDLGRYLLEVQAVGASEYEISFPEREPVLADASAARATVTKARPEHPLTVSDPLSAGQVGPAVAAGGKGYLPVMFR